MTENKLAFIDLETTGFSPKQHDKIVEIAIVTTDLNGNVIEEYQTLINPKRDVSASHIHGLTAELVKDAPTIEEAMEDIMYHLQNKTVVGHNIDFDLRFLNHELDKYLDNHTPIKGLCTLKLSKLVEPNVPARNLSALCEYFGIENTNAHSAMGDCKATLDLFKLFLPTINEKVSPEEFEQHFLSPAIFEKEAVPNGYFFLLEDALRIKDEKKSSFQNLLNRLPANPTHDIPVKQYLNLLDNVLADRVITKEETEALFEFAAEFSISCDQLVELHKEYLQKLIRFYLLDEILSESEMTDLYKVADLLLLDEANLNELVEIEKSNISKQFLPNLELNSDNYKSKSVCFTGKLESYMEGSLIDRNLAQQLATERGMIIKGGVCKTLDYLVTVDPESLSGKAKKAREYGVKIIAEPVFWKMIGIAIE